MLSMPVRVYMKVSPLPLKILEFEMPRPHLYFISLQYFIALFPQVRCFNSCSGKLARWLCFYSLNWRCADNYLLAGL